MSIERCPHCTDGCEFCRPLGEMMGTEHNRNEEDRLKGKIQELVDQLPKPYADLQKAAVYALMAYLATVGGAGTTTMEVVAVHEPGGAQVSRFQVQTELNEPIIRRLG